MQLFLFIILILGAFLTLPVYYFFASAIGFLIGCLFMNVKTPKIPEYTKQKLEIPPSNPKENYSTCHSEIKLNVATSPKQKTRTEYTISNSSKFSDFIKNQKKEEILTGNLAILHGLPKSIISPDVGKNEAVDYVCKLFNGAFSQDTFNLLSKVVLQELYLVCYKHFSNINITHSDFALFIENTRLGHNIGKNNQIDKCNKANIDISSVLNECKKIYQSRSKNSSQPADGTFAKWEVDCLVEFHKKGIELVDLSLIFGRSVAALRRKLISKGAYITKSLENNTVSEQDDDRMMELVIIRICRILNADHHWFRQLDELGLDNLELLEKILKYPH